MAILNKRKKAKSPGSNSI